MRFLLNVVRQSSRAIQRESKPTKPVLATFTEGAKVSQSVSSNNDTSFDKSWGQQCSQNCGCVVRFEVTVDPATQTIVDASYYAKSIIALSKDNRLEPFLTSRTNKPMLKACKCKTVHTLAKEITSYVSNQKLDRVRNMTEFSFTRSSPAFRHAVLVNNELPRTDTHCFDVVEEAFTAMTKGFLPHQRRHTKSFDKMLSIEFAQNMPSEDDDEIIAPRRRREIGMDRAQLSMSSPTSVSALRMFDINAEYWENEQHSKHQHEDIEKARRSLDWLSFVDEQNRSEESA